MAKHIMELRKLVGHKPLQMVACTVFLFDKENRVLLTQRADDKTWCVPGGLLELGEKTEDCAIRECFEETGLTPLNLILHSVCSGEEHHFFYPHGDEVYAVDINYLCYEYSGELKKQDAEVLILKFFSLHGLPETINKNDRKIIEQVLNKVNQITEYRL